MRKYAWLREPLKKDENEYIYKIMLYESEEGILLFEYSHPDANQCSSDRWYESLEDLYDEWNERIDERGWMELEDPLPDCQHDAFIPLRVKGRETGNPEWGKYVNMNYKVIDRETYYRRGVFRHFSEDCKCSSSMTARIDVTDLVHYSKAAGTKFYINFLYILSKVLNSREDYRMGYLWQTDELICYDVINPTQYVFHEDTETFTLAYTAYEEDYDRFYEGALRDAEEAKKTREYGLDMENHPNWFDASYISWLSYDSLNIELPDGHLFFAPIVNWGKYREENGRLVMPVTVRLNHAIADGYLVANVFRLLELEIKSFADNDGH